MTVSESMIGRFDVCQLAENPPAWLVRLDGAPLLHVTDNHIAINDLRATHQFRWGFALLRSPWTDAPRLAERDGVVDLYGGDERVGILRWDPKHPAHLEVTVFDLGNELLHAEVRYRQLPGTGVGGVPAISR